MGPSQTPGGGISPAAALQDSNCFDKREEISITSFLQFFSDFPEYIVRFCARELKSKGNLINGKTLLKECSDRFDPDQIPGPDELPTPTHSESLDSHRSQLKSSAVSSSASVENLSDSGRMGGEVFYSLPADFHRESLLTASGNNAPLTNGHLYGEAQFQVSAGLPATNMSTPAADIDMEDDWDEVDGFCGNMPGSSISAGLPAMSFSAEGEVVPISSAYGDVEVDCDEVDGLCGNMVESSVSAGFPAVSILMGSGGAPNSSACYVWGQDCVDGFRGKDANSRTITAGLPAMNILTEGAVVTTPATYQNMTADRDQGKKDGIMTESYVAASGLPAMNIPTSSPNNTPRGACGFYQHMDGSCYQQEDCVDGLSANNYSPEMDVTNGLLAMDIGADGDSANTPASDPFSTLVYEDEDCVDGLLGDHLPNTSRRGDSFPVGAASGYKVASNSGTSFKATGSQTLTAASRPDKANKDRLAAMTKQHEIMENHRLCTKCKTNPRDTTFLPCGHFITCSDCAEPIFICPACQITIIGTVKTILSPLLPNH